MRNLEQRDLINDLREHEAKMSRAELEDFEMFKKRHKDDEDLDEMSMKRLKQIHAKYVRSERPTSNPLDSLFRPQS